MKKIRKISLKKARQRMRERKEKIKIGVGKVRANMKKNKEKIKNGVEKVKEGMGKAKRKIWLARPLLLVDGITLSNSMFGMLSIFAVVRGFPRQACYFLLIAVVMDYLDGKFAKKLGRTSPIGKELDSLADTISFGVAPAVFGFMLAEGIFIIIPLIIFLSCGIIRLAKFNVQVIKGHYFGMPITMNGILIPIIYFGGVPLPYWPYIYFISAVLMVIPFKLKKVL
jgi:CDP-diacylglycerol--serine O-phosphatidyltransferase